MKLKKGDKVIVIAGKSRGVTGTVARVITKKDQVVIDGVNMAKKHRKASGQSRKGQIIDKVMPIHVSNVMLADPKDGTRTRIKITRSKDGNRQRIAVKSGTAIS
ncbi:50S ribosomal protein L24 [Candidatus Kaiserbacteria bacterium RIFCSPHIGHO2_01_FULL_56_24]|uniref:Large ribosomal subunit protein uL24 n=1 Tax=Candidatus Kaiserbacteria bacterium RIFCSPHIGHO2_01_FULL_56_24 TaxID=1798487 RepID=A0A1F6D8F3_9BACT|nr:MAG: 50S ribosomal protein L24 [Candidatus Kaiserbacteria bacterium RIFCSPHIGHO2_01_FULL_56_24]